MELFTIQCTTCRARLKVKDESIIGSILNCPKCQSMVHIVPPVGWKRPSAEPQSASSSGPSAGALSVADSAQLSAVQVAAARTAPIPAPMPAPASATAPRSAPKAAAPPVVPPRAQAAAAVPVERSSLATGLGATADLPNSTHSPEGTSEAIATSHGATWLERVRGDWPLIAAGLGAGAVVGTVAWLFIAFGSGAPDDAAERPLASNAPPAAAAPSGPSQPAQAPDDRPTPAAAASNDPAAKTQEALPTDIAPESKADAPAASAATVTAAEDPAAKDTAAVEPPSTAPAPATTPMPATAAPAAAGDPARPSLKLEPSAVPAPAGSPEDAIADELLPASAGDTAPAAEAPDKPAADGAAPDAASASNAAPDARVLSSETVDKRLAMVLGEVKFVGVPLAQFVNFISDATVLPITIDDAALTKAGKKRSLPVSVHLNDTTAGDALRAALAPLGLTYEVRGRRLMIVVAPPRN